MKIINTCLLGVGLLLVNGCSDQPTPTSDSTTPSTATISFPLGNETELTTLYSYPNSDNGESLEATIEHYLNQRLQRDHIANGSADVTVEKDLYSVTMRGDATVINEYKPQIIQFLTNGALAASAVTQLKKDNKWDAKEWRFFLPLGLSIVNQRSVQLLHFPPDYSLPDQDYLNSKTSQRWEKLLMLNQVAADEVTLYESILDVAPIAAPASAGSTLSETYRYFEPYVVSMLPLLLDIDEGSSSALPIVAYGGPVRSWVSSYYKLNDFGVNTVASVTIQDGINAPMLGANHPSYIWYAKDQGREAAMKVMQQDLISACWQASMGKDAQQNPSSVLNSCDNYWQSQPMTVCVNMEIQAFDQSETEAKASCSKDIPDTIKAVLPEEQIHPLSF
ncbi:hypothetical protein [Pseudomaricurvus sp.]|uniref:hypothetical protein n=1 Tax=Pseudomaricurvus sp. TaxID=2004510 RepID=UPI003F6A7D94